MADPDELDLVERHPAVTLATLELAPLGLALHTTADANGCDPIVLATGLRVRHVIPHLLLDPEAVRTCSGRVGSRLVPLVSIATRVFDRPAEVEERSGTTCVMKDHSFGLEIRAWNDRYASHC